MSSTNDTETYIHNLWNLSNTFYNSKGVNAKPFTVEEGLALLNLVLLNTSQRSKVYRRAYRLREDIITNNKDGKNRRAQ